MMKMNPVLIAILALPLGSSSFAADKKAAAASPEVLAKGKESFLKNCVLCHGEKGDGNGPAGAMRNPKPRNFAPDKFRSGGKPEQLLKVVTEGLTGTGMAGFPHLPEDERRALVAYVLSFKKK